MEKFCNIKRIIICLVLLCLVCSQTVGATVMDTNAPYFGDHLFVYNPTDTNQTLSPTVSPKLSSAMLFDMHSEKEADIDEDVQVSFTPDYSQLNLPNNLQESPKVNCLDAPILYSANSSVGRNYIYLVSNLATGSYYNQKFICQATGQYCNILVEPDANGAAKISRADAQKLVAEFDNHIQPFMVENFGNYYTYLGTDTSGIYLQFSQNKKMDILVYDIQDGYNGTTKRSYVGGYTDLTDFIGENLGGNGNEKGILHIDIYPSMGKSDTPDVEKCYSTIVHEFQHQISYSDSVYDYFTGAATSYINDAWWNEAFSMAAEHLYGGEPLTYRIEQYNDTGKSKVLRNGLVLGYLNYTENNNDVIANYSTSYLFGQYLRCQTKHLAGGGNRIYRTILEQIGTDYTTILAGLASIDYKYTPETFEELYLNFRMATILKNSTGPYGFAGEDAFSVLVDNAYTETSDLTLKPGAAVILRVPENFTPTNNDLFYTAFSDCGDFTYEINAVSDTMVNVTHGSLPQCGLRMLAAGYDGDMKLLGTDEITVSEYQENYDYTLPKNSVIKKFFLLANDGSLKPLAHAETR